MNLPGTDVKSPAVGTATHSAIAVLVLLATGGCVARPVSMAGSYPGGVTSAPRPLPQVIAAPSIKYGRVVEVRPVTIEGQAGNLGRYGGGVAGAIATGPRSLSTGDLLGAAVGSVVGSVVGGGLQKMATRQNGQEILIRMDDGEAVSVIQHAHDGYFEEGDRVRVINGAQGAHVSMETDPDGTPTELAGSRPWYEEAAATDDSRN